MARRAGRALASSSASHLPQLAGTLDAVVPSLPTGDGAFTVPLGDGELSVVPWLPDATRPRELTREAVTVVGRLHAAAPPERIRRWHSVVDPDLPAWVEARVHRPWTEGPLGEQARDAVRSRRAEISQWSHEHTRLVAAVDPATYVPTHGEPGVHNQLLVPGRGLVLVDWESLLLAPRERDSSATVAPDGRWREGYLDGRALLNRPDDRLDDRLDHRPDAGLLRLFELEWRLAEIAAYSEWLGGPHLGTPDDHTALTGLLDELAGS